MAPDEAMRRLDALAAHVWMVRTFLKHSEEAEEDDELMEVVRVLYDYCLALGPAWTAQDAAAYLKVVRKKLGRLKQATHELAELLPRVSAHTNFKMALASLQTALDDIGRTLEAADK
jgi:sulfur relay (sulfurtransferase) DsrC/TusE family protein